MPNYASPSFFRASEGLATPLHRAEQRDKLHPHPAVGVGFLDMFGPDRIGLENELFAELAGLNVDVKIPRAGIVEFSRTGTNLGWRGCHSLTWKILEIEEVKLPFSPKRWGLVTTSGRVLRSGVSLP
jgi:hypothetical protein